MQDTEILLQIPYSLGKSGEGEYTLSTCSATQETETVMQVSSGLRPNEGLMTEMSFVE